MRCVLSTHLNASEALAPCQLRTSVLASHIDAATLFSRLGRIFGTVRPVVKSDEVTGSTAPVGRWSVASTTFPQQ
jgi:hypothetical protein